MQFVCLNISDLPANYKINCHLLQLVDTDFPLDILDHQLKLAKFNDIESLILILIPNAYCLMPIAQCLRPVGHGNKMFFRAIADVAFV